jgi:glycosyltransferase involved in cell wall biosynthesis
LTTVYNGYEFLGECAKSVLSQQEHYNGLDLSWEWWIGINGHGEGGEALRIALSIQALDPRIHVVNQSVCGRVNALNDLKSRTIGEWVAVLDCDDLWEPEKLITQMMAIRMAKIDVIGTFCSYFGEYSGAPALPAGWINDEDIRAGNPIINSSVLIRSDLAVWEDRFGLEDYDLWLRLNLEGKRLFNIPHSLVKHRIHAASAFNGKGQDLKGLRIFYGLSPPTVVTAYYPIRSNYSVE